MRKIDSDTMLVSQVQSDTNMPIFGKAKWVYRLLKVLKENIIL